MCLEAAYQEDSSPDDLEQPAPVSPESLIYMGSVSRQVMAFSIPAMD